MNNTPTLTQSEEEMAPYNEKFKVIEVNVSQCLSTVVKIEVPEDFDENNIENYVREQVILPSELTFQHSPDCWYVDDFCVSL